MKTVVSERGQITLPKSIRTDLGIRPGTVIELSIVDGQIVGWKREAEDAMSAWRGRGTLPPGFKSVDDYIEAIRG